MQKPGAASLRAVCHRTGDMPGAMDFYTSALGLTLRFADGDRWAEFEAGGARFALGGPSEFLFGADGPLAVFEVADLDDARGRVLAAGGAVDGERDMGDHGRYLTIRDPSGNRMLLFGRAGN